MQRLKRKAQPSIQLTWHGSQLRTCEKNGLKLGRSEQIRETFGANFETQTNHIRVEASIFIVQI